MSVYVLTPRAFCRDALELSTVESSIAREGAKILGRGKATLTFEAGEHCHRQIVALWQKQCAISLDDWLEPATVEINS